MFDLEPILRCPYCIERLSYRWPSAECTGCGRTYHERDGMVYMYDASMDHWKECQAQLDALFRLEYDPDWTPRHDPPGYPYEGLENPGLGHSANAAMFNVTKDLIGERMYSDGYALDIAAYNGWASFRLAEHKKTIALDTSDHKRYGMGSVPSVGMGIRKVVADGCYLPFADSSFDVIFSASGFHHMHDKLRALNEAHRCLAAGGVYVAIGDRAMPAEQHDFLNNDGIRDYEGPPYSPEQLQEWLDDSAFDDINILPIRYTEHMHFLGYYSLVGAPDTNAIIHGVKP